MSGLAFAAEHLTQERPAEQLVLEVTDGYAIHTADFYFSEDYKGLERFAKAGSVIAVDGGEETKPL